MIVDRTFTCPRCNGRGYLPSFQHINNGKCFLCNGAKIISIKEHNPRAKELTVSVNNHGKYGIEILVTYCDKANACVRTALCDYIDDDNREEYRAMYAWLRHNGATMIVNETRDTH